MFSIIIAIIAIALVVALVLASHYFGGSAISEATAHAEAARLKNEEQQLMGAVDVFQARTGRWPHNLQELVTSGELSSIPRGQSVIAAASPSLISSAHAQSETPGWSSPAEDLPIYITQATVPEETCRKFNLESRGDDGILRNINVNLSAQCYGSAGAYRVVINKVAVASSIASALEVPVTATPVPSDSASSDWTLPPVATTSPPKDEEPTEEGTFTLAPLTGAGVDLVQSGSSFVLQAPADPVNDPYYYAMRFAQFRLTAAGDKTSTVPALNGPYLLSGANVLSEDGCTPGQVMSPGQSCTLTVVAYMGQDYAEAFGLTSPPACASSAIVQLGSTLPSIIVQACQEPPLYLTVNNAYGLSISGTPYAGYQLMKSDDLNIRFALFVIRNFSNTDKPVPNLNGSPYIQDSGEIPGNASVCTSGGVVPARGGCQFRLLMSNSSAPGTVPSCASPVTINIPGLAPITSNGCMP